MDSGRGRWTGVALFSAMILAWSGNYLFAREGLLSSSPLWLATLRAGIGAATVGLYRAVQRVGSTLSTTEKRDAVLLGIPNTALFLGLWFTAAQSVATGVTAVLIYTFPVWVAVFSVPVLNDRIEPVQGAAIAAGFVGVAFVAQPWAGPSGGLGFASVAELLGAAVSWAVATVLFQRRFAPGQLAEVNLYQLLGGSLALGAASVLGGGRPPTPTPLLAVSLLWLGVYGTAVAYSIWFWLLQRRPASTVSALAFLVPLGALLLGAAFEAERVTPVQAGGIALVVTSVYLVAARRSPRADSAPTGD